MAQKYPEVNVVVGNIILCFPQYPDKCDYVRILDIAGNELYYWIADEWEQEPDFVMGAIMGAIAEGVK